MLTTSIESAESTLVGDIAAAKSMLTTSIESAENTLVDDIAGAKSMLTTSIILAETNLLVAIQSAGVGQTDALTTLFDEHNQAHSDFEAFNVRLQIERILGNDEGDRIALFQLPTAVGGYLELVREIVVQTMEAATLAGLNVEAALVELEKGDLEFDAGEYGKSFESYGKAYRIVLDA